MNFNPSEYQKKIFEFVTKGTGNAVINAKAGSGKTTTLVEAMKLIPEKEKVLFDWSWCCCSWLCLYVI